MRPLSPMGLLAFARLHTQSDVINFTVVTALVLVGILVAVGVPLYRYLKEDAEADEPEGEPISDSDLLAQFDAARKTGEMSEDEYQKVSATIRGRMQRAVEKPAPPPAPASPQHPEARGGKPAQS